MKKIMLVLFVVVMILGCTKEQATAEFADVTFSVDQSLLSEEYICSDIGISFYPPTGWERISSGLMTAITEKLKASQDTTGVTILPLDVFMDKEKSATCFISIFISEFPADETRKNYLNEIRIKNQDLSINEGTFAHNELDFYQLTFTKDDLITVKLIAANNEQKVFMIDYAVPSKYYEEELRTIESSIGTIKKTKNEIGLPGKTGS
ncbi:MAG: hypothetical protein PF570_02520 [Candidatus Cloacimonetes bacterium]|jgi:hypothetical protein|nr:hypothetical protein [Candidatus Cloacimonadota bacterium]